MKNLLIFSVLLFFLLGCGGLKKEVTRLTEESKSKTEMYERRISELNTKISETESRETNTKTELERKTSEIATLKKERTELQEQLEKKERSDFSVDNPKGPVQVTDSKGNTYKFEGGEGTRITNSSESSLSTKLQATTESLSQEVQRTESLSQTVQEQDVLIKKKDTEIKEKTEETSKLKEKITVLNEALAKAVLKKGIPWYVWMLAGVFLLAAVQLLWKIYKLKFKIKL